MSSPKHSCKPAQEFREERTALQIEQRRFADPAPAEVTDKSPVRANRPPCQILLSSE
jgi:hypothetical protein